MSTAEILNAARDLSRDEQIVLVQALWDNITETAPTEVDDELKAELDRRIADDDSSQGEGLTWEQVKQRLLARK